MKTKDTKWFLDMLAVQLEMSENGWEFLEDNCDCMECVKSRDCKYQCDYCGYTGEPAFRECDCSVDIHLDYCSHGEMYCPWCEEGKADVWSLFAWIRHTLRELKENGS